jgi:hypothetical protein
MARRLDRLKKKLTHLRCKRSLDKFFLILPFTEDDLILSGVFRGVVVGRLIMLCVRISDVAGTVEIAFGFREHNIF